MLKHLDDNWGEQEIQHLQKLMRDIDADIPVPDSISPEHMKKKLQNPPRKIPIQKYIAAAACFLLVMGCAVTVSMLAGVKMGMTKAAGQNLAGGMSSSSTATADMMPESASPSLKMAKEDLAAEELTEMKAQSYDAIAQALEPIAQRNMTFGQGIYTDENGNKVNPPTAGSGTGGTDGSATSEEGNVDKNNPGTAGAGEQDVSRADQTNTQVEGVSEADIVKTDGDYVYYSTSDTVSIVKMGEGGDMQQVGKIKDKDFCYTLDMFLDNDSLVVLSSSDTSLDSQRKMLSDSSGITRNTVKTTIYDVSNPAAPEVERVITQEGDYQDARMIDGKLYLVSQQYMPLEKSTEDLEPTDYIPAVTDSAASEARLLSADCIYLLPTVESPCYNIVSAVDVGNPAGAVNTRAILGSSSQMYVSADNMYLVSQTYDNVAQVSYSNVYKLKLSGLQIVMTASGRVKGGTINQFSMDENDGYFRIATNLFDGRNNRTTNNLYVLDEKLELVSYLENMAEGEDLKSVRFMGDTAYLVTFEQVDPLFAIDLSDPANPKVAGQLKIPGFSSYLHPISEDLLVGVGYDTKEVKDRYGNTSTVTGGIKLSLFDVSDPANPQEVNNLVLGDCGSWSDIITDHKALLYYQEKQIIGIPVNLTQNTTPGQSYTNSRYEDAFSGYVLFQIADNKLSEIGRITHQRADQTQGTDYSLVIRRGVYRGGYVYTLSDLKIKSTSLSDFQDVKELPLG